MVKVLNRSISPVCVSLAYLSYINPSICGGLHLEMPLMWLVMALAHLPSWIQE